MYKNNWVDIHYPRQGEKLEVSFNIPERSVETIPFHVALDDAAKEIAKKHNDIFIPLTGGQDSELCCNVFLRNNIPFTPVIFMTPYNLQEVKYAIQYSENLSLKTKFLYFYDEFKFNQEILPRFIEFLSRIKRVRWFNVSPYVISTFLPGTYITGTMDPWSLRLDPPLGLSSDKKCLTRCLTPIAKADTNVTTDTAKAAQSFADISLL